MDDAQGAAPPEAIELQKVLLSPGYGRVLLIAAAIGAPVSLAAFGFLVAVHELQHVLWETWPRSLFDDEVPWWWPLPLLVLAGALVGLIITRLPGRGGHVPAEGTTVGITPPRELPGILLAAAASLSLGAVIGPEAPLIAAGSGLAVLFAAMVRIPNRERALMIVAASGGAAATAAIFGNPLVAAVLLLEAVSLAGPMMVALMLPCLLSTAIGALIFTGLGRWTGLSIGALAVPRYDAPARPDLADLLWTVPVALVAAVGIRLVLGLAHRVLPLLRERVLEVTTLVGLGVGACAALYALLADRSPDEVAMSGQMTLPVLVADPRAWAASALVLVLLFKGVAYALSLAAFRGGAIFPAVFLGAALGVLVADLPGFGSGPAIAAGMAAATAAVMRLPIASILIVTLLLGAPVAAMLPVVLLATVIGVLAVELPVRRRAGGSSG